MATANPCQAQGTRAARGRGRRYGEPFLYRQHDARGGARGKGGGGQAGRGLVGPAPRRGRLLRRGAGSPAPSFFSRRRVALGGDCCGKPRLCPANWPRKGLRQGPKRPDRRPGHGEGGGTVGTRHDGDGGTARMRHGEDAAWRGRGTVGTAAWWGRHGPAAFRARSRLWGRARPVRHDRLRLRAIFGAVQKGLEAPPAPPAPKDARNQPSIRHGPTVVQCLKSFDFSIL